MKVLRLLPFWFCLACSSLAAGAEYQDRFVWVFGWDLQKDSDVAEISRLFETAGRHGFNGAVLSCGLDMLGKQNPDFFRRLEQVKLAAQANKLELVPSVFSIGYGGGILAHDRNLAEGLPVIDAPFLADGSKARFLPDKTIRLANGGFEESKNNRLAGFNLQDSPGEESIIDKSIKHGGEASLRLENFSANPAGNGRVMQTIKLHPHRLYRVTLWIKTEGLKPAGGFYLQALAAGGRSLSPQDFHVEPTSDWHPLTLVLNSLEFETVNLYAGMWGGREGKLWLDDWSIEEIGPINVLHRPGTPVTVRSEDGSTIFAEGKDYARLEDPNYSLYHVEHDWPSLHLLPGSSIKQGQKLLVNWYHGLAINDSQVTVCMAEPELYEICDHEAKLLAEHLHPQRVLLNTDEIRMGGTCEACKGRNMGELLGESVTRQAQILRKHIPGAKIYVWSHMFDPNHNAHGNYYLVQGDFTGSWNHVPKDIVMAVWGGEPSEKSLRFSSEQGFETLVACYYDADNLDDVKGWLRTASGVPNVRGFMYTPWLKKYALLPDFGELLTAARK
jgi:hypothetical protein